jgi:SAM-dependent methyltransferase
LRLVGDLPGQRVLALACGCGFYTRLLKQRGAAQVLGIDISPEMVRLACAQEQEDPTGVAYRVGDATELPVLGAFELVTAVYLLNDATSKAQRRGMCRSAYNNLVAGGRFIAYTVNPVFTLRKPNSTKRGVTMLRQSALWGSLLAGCLRPLSRHRAGRPAVTWDTLPMIEGCDKWCWGHAARRWYLFEA